MIVTVRKGTGARSKRYKNVHRVSRVKFTSNICIVGECPCCGKKYTKTVDADWWSIEEEKKDECDHD